VLQFESQQPGDLRRIIPLTSGVVEHHRFHGLTLDVWARKAPGIEKDIFYIARQRISVPKAKVAELVTPEKDALQMER